ncbi:hypothetical protein Srubr_55150 [Streptomyces rubradiris]|uniref:Uncharacterized protein n=1 Tax=Streptomyces rubradiris TaxID=285531 RepID=A0ABQ3RII0_STRRR|nr:hypothetical protein Srubr_55150 [Streptomyces rubradiris]
MTVCDAPRNRAPSCPPAGTGSGRGTWGCARWVPAARYRDCAGSTLGEEVMDLPADPGQRLVVLGAEPGSASEEALRLLAASA